MPRAEVEILRKKISGAARGAKKATIHAADEQPGEPAAIVRFTFDTDELEVIPESGRLLVSVRGVCRALGVDASTQLAKLRGDPAASVVLIPAEVNVGGRRAVRELACIDVRQLPLWLARIHPNKVREELRPKLIRYQLDAAEVLAEHFLGRRGAAPSTPPPSPPPTPPALPPAASSGDRHREAALELLGPDLDARVHRALLRLPSPRRRSVRFWMARAQELNDLLVGALSVGGVPPPRSPSEALAYAERIVEVLDREVDLISQAPSPDAEGLSRDAELLFRWARVALADAALVRAPEEQERRKEAIVRLAGLANRFTMQATKLRKTKAAPALPPARRRAGGGS